MTTSVYYYVRSNGSDPYQAYILRKARWENVSKNVLLKENAGVKVTVSNMNKKDSTYTKLLENARAQGYGKVFGAYNIKLSSGTIGKKGLDIAFDLGTKNNGKQAVVTHKKSDGSYEQFVQTVKDGKVVINVKELSPFMVSLKGGITNSTAKQLDDEPKTGVPDYTVFTGIIIFISVTGLAVLKFRN